MRLPVRQYWRLLARYLTVRRRLLVVFALIVFAELAVRLATPWFAGQFLNAVTAGSAPRLGALLALAALYCIAGIVDQLLSVAGVQFGSYVSWLATNDLRVDVVRHCLALDLDFHHAHAPGEIVERIDGDAGNGQVIDDPAVFMTPPHVA